MTVEIAIMTRDAVTLAADSAVTVSGLSPTDSGLFPTEKTYNSANKVFMLSDNYPVGIMFYGNAGLMGIGWETLVKLYRAKRRSAPTGAFEKLKDYSDDFIKFIDKEAPDLVDWPTLIEETKCVVTGYLDELQRLEGKECKKWIEEAWEDCMKMPLLDPDSGVAKFDETARNELTEYINEYQENSPGNATLSNAMIKRLIDICEETLSREDDNCTSMVIAGFGESEIFPSLMHHTVWGYHKQQLRVTSEGPLSISLAKSSLVYPCAQKQEIESFLGGIDPQIMDFFLSETPSLLEELIDDLIQESKSSVMPKSLTIPKETRKKIIEKYSSMFKRFFSLPVAMGMDQVLDTISAMPKEEIAAMAEALINMTSLKLRATGDLETVGGHADVALISKGDGFVWVKRKSKISLELNPHLASKTQMWETVQANPLG